MPEETCAEIKARYGIKTGKHSDNKKANAGSGTGEQSHHILQGAATNDLIDYDQAMAVLLQNSHSGTTHQITTARQNERRDNKKNGRGGAQPATNFGDLKKLSRDDLVESFKQGEGMPQKDAEKLADCLVAEAEKEVKKAAEKKDIEVNDSTPVLQTGGCLPAGTLVWLDDVRALPVEQVQPGEWLQGRQGARPVVRTDLCRQDLVRLWVGDASVDMAPFHRVLLADGRRLRADRLRAGHEVATARGVAVLAHTEHMPARQPIHSFGVGAHFECRVGPMGLWVDLPDTGAAVRETVALHPWQAPSWTGSTHAGCHF